MNGNTSGVPPCCSRHTCSRSRSPQIFMKIFRALLHSWQRTLHNYRCFVNALFMNSKKFVLHCVSPPPNTPPTTLARPTTTCSARTSHKHYTPKK
eukprot:6334833-Amphidinium_carterae.1